MKTHVQKWGNSLALRIPKTFAQEAGIDSGSVVELRFVDGQIIVAPISEPTLDDLLSQITDENLHNEVDTGDPLGNEIW